MGFTTYRLVFSPESMGEMAGNPLQGAGRGWGTQRQWVKSGLCSSWVGQGLLGPTSAEATLSLMGRPRDGREWQW